jgi:predicted transposase/invertase (TIGR01784 family)
LLNWFKFLCEEKRITEADFKQLNQVYYDEGEMGMLINAIRKEKREIFKQGKIEGKFEEKLEIAKSMLLKGLNVELIVEITQLSKEEIEQLKN